MIKICAFADEADQQLDGQIAALKRNGVSLIEIRGINGKNVSTLTTEEAEEYSATLKKEGITVWSIGSPLGKISIDKDIEEHMELTRHVCRLAKIFGTNKIRMFSFYKAKKKEELVFDALRRMVEIAREENVQLYHENEGKIYGDVPDRILKIMENVEGLKYVYDPANFLNDGISPEESITKLYDKMDYFHVKDVIAETKEQVPAGYGNGRIDELLRNIPEDKMAVFTIEPHLKVVSPDNTEEIEELKSNGKMYYTGSNEAFDAAINALRNLLSQVGFTETDGVFYK